jgi:hypothetical protein
MKNQRFIFGIFVLFAVLKVDAQGWRTDSPATNPPDFTKLSYEEARSAIIDETAKYRSPEYIANLLNQVRSGQLNPDNKAFAIDLLGMLQTTNADVIEFLIQNIDFERKRLEKPGGPNVFLKYPCEGALMRIGKPVVDILS